MEMCSRKGQGSFVFFFFLWDLRLFLKCLLDHFYHRSRTLVDHPPGPVISPSVGWDAGIWGGADGLLQHTSDAAAFIEEAGALEEGTLNSCWDFCRSVDSAVRCFSMLTQPLSCKKQ